MSNLLFTKLARIMGKIGTLEKDGTNTHFGYKFTSDETVYNAVRGLLSDEGVAVLASMVAVSQDTVTNAKGVPQLHTRCDFKFVFADGESGETWECPWSAEAIGADDKGINKSATAALKYWLLKTFIIPSGDDPDKESGDFGGRQSASKPAPQQATPSAGMKDETGDRPAANGKPAPATDNAKVNREKGWNTDAGLIQALRAIWDHPVPEMLNRLKKMEEADEIGRNDPQADVLKAYELHMAAKK